MRNICFITAIGLILLATACGGEAETTSPQQNTEAPAPKDDGKGIGPVKDLELPATIDPALAEKGKIVFEAKCTACHQFEGKYVGPSLGGITERRKPEWIMNMILNPEEMTKKDPQAKELLAEHLTQMTFQDVSEEEARALLEYFRQYDAKN